MNARGEPRFTAYSAGNHPSGTVRPGALKQLEAAHITTTGFRSKSWDEFAKPEAPKMDFVFTVCDNAANEVCPIWPGHPVTAHWGLPDPAAVQGTDKEIERAYRDAFLTLERRISMFLSLPLDTIDQMAIKKDIDKIVANEIQPARPTDGGVSRQRVPRCGCDRLRHHGRTAGGWKRRHCSACEHDCDGRCISCSHTDLRPDFRCTPKPGCHGCRRN
jgi:arsenate reductase